MAQLAHFVKSKRRIVLIGLLALVGLGLLVVIPKNRPYDAAPKVAILFQGYTNDSAGGRAGRFVITNSDNQSVEFYGVSTIVRVKGRGVSRFVPGVVRLMMLNPGENMAVQATPQQPNVPWGLSILAYTDLQQSRSFHLRINSAMRALGFAPRYREMPYAIHSSWVEPESVAKNR